MLLDDDDLPVPQACEWFLSRRHLEINTLMRNANEVIVIHKWAKGADLTYMSEFDQEYSLLRLI
ncbi:hypothetical protein LOY37_24385 [Pseudomonas sp. B21-012]|uniref:hypothetical protein n=1 Tax=Pseudomonas sp. B21-012 TaxID=2895472 RepID=UPI002160821B|nr:hypothetical protein [Pseudomonas sp. B21-012]UVM55433.1 hypothetical protein LOY37_24385 [Pseudomonas sp. B21-012]